MKNQQLRDQRANLLRECEALRQPDGTFSDPARFDALMTRIEGIDAVERGDATYEQRSAIFSDLATRDEQSGGPDPNAQHIGADVGESRGDLPMITHMAEALVSRFGGPAPSEAARQYRHTRLPDMMRQLLEHRGVSTRGLGDVAIVKRVLGGHTTSDFPALLTETGNRFLRAGYDSYQGGVRRICRQTTAPDFRPINKLNLSEAPALVKVLEHGEVTRGSMSEVKESYSIATFARIFSLSRQAIVNDDLGGFSDFARRQGRAAAELIASELATLLTSNPTMNDGVALFHATHKNLGTAAAITIVSLGEALKLMRKQTGLDGKTPIDATPKFLVVPAAIEVVGKQFVAEITAAKSADVNPFSADLEVVVDPRLDANSATAWYLAADPNQIDTIEYAFLDDAPGPQFESREGFDVLGAEMRVTLDFGAGVIDHRGLVKNAGA